MDFIVVGIGWAGRRHVQAIQCLQRQGRDVSVAAIVDTDPAHLAASSAELGVERTFADLDTALAEVPRAGAVVLATPHHLHRAGTERAAVAGMHVLVEKPMALSLADADAMIRACRSAGVELMVLESLRYQRRAMELARLVGSGRIGRVLYGRMNMIGRGRTTFAYPGRRAWLADPNVCGGGIWMLNGIHQMSAARMLLGEVAEITAAEVHSERFVSPLEGTVAAMLRFDSGAILHMTVSAELHGYNRFGDLVLFGTDGTLGVNWGGPDGITVCTEQGTETVPCDEGDESEPAPHFIRQMAEFMASLAEGRPSQTDGLSERHTLAAILAGYESIRTGAPVRPQPFAACP